MSSEAVPETGRSSSATPARISLIVAIALLLLNLLLVSQREMVPEEYDAFEYAQASLEGLRALSGGASIRPAHL